LIAFGDAINLVEHPLQEGVRRRSRNPGALQLESFFALPANLNAHPFDRIKSMSGIVSLCGIRKQSVRIAPIYGIEQRAGVFSITSAYAVAGRSITRRKWQS
jgi:hypothetical protein